MKGLSSRFHLALGLTSMVVSLLLLASYLGLVPDRDGAIRAGRVGLAESLAIAGTSLMDESDPAKLRAMLGMVAERNKDLRSIGVRRADATLVIEIGEHASHWRAVQGTVSSDSQVVVPILRGASRWGTVELRFSALRPAGWIGAMLPPAASLGVFLGLGCFVVFFFYLRRMLRHLDPSSAIPGRVRSAFDTLAEGLLVLDTRGQIVLANQAFADVVGREADDLIGVAAHSLDWKHATGALVDGSDVPWAASLDDGIARRSILMYLVDRAGARRTFMINCSPVLGAGAKPAGVLVSLDDVTRLEEKEIELRIAKDAADTANRAKSDFLANMSHEIRTPMNAILGFTELLRRGYRQGASDSARHLNTIHSSGQHLLALINDILDLSKVESGRLEVERIAFGAHTAIREVVRVMNVKAQEKGIGLRVEFPDGVPETISSDPGRLRQILTNLVGNALKFTTQGEVSITARVDRSTDAPRLVVDVADTGVGIPGDKLESVFEPFVQAEASTTRNFGGTGLGLTISRKFARALGGDIVARSEPGRGSVFTVTLDAGSLDGVRWLGAGDLAESGEIVDNGTLPAWVFPDSRVLVVDDGVENRELVRLVLEESGLRVAEAGDGRAALDRLAAESFDLVLMDLQMPVMDGITATRALRARGDGIPVIALTANAMKGFEAEIEEAGFSGYLTKPIDIDLLIGELAARLGAVRGRERTTVVPAPIPESPRTSVEFAAVEPAAVESRLAAHPKLAKVVRSFARALPAKLDAMRQALDAGELGELANLAHWLKGAGGTVGFDAFFEPARELEQCAKRGDAPACGSRIDELKALAARIVVPGESPALAHGEPAALTES